MMDYLKEFPESIQAEIELERDRAGVEAASKKVRGVIPPAAQIERILSVFFASAKRAATVCTSVQQFNAVCEECLLGLTREADHNLVGEPYTFMYMEGSRPKITDAVREEMEASPLWKKYREIRNSFLEEKARPRAAQLVPRQVTSQDKQPTAKSRDDAEVFAERAARRQAVVNPILQQKRWKPGRLVTEAGVGKNSVYRYLDGTRVKITDKNREAIAQALDLTPEQLPD